MRGRLRALVLSDVMGSTINSGVGDFLRGRSDIRVSVVTLHELIHGLERLPEGKRRSGLTDTLEAYLSLYGDAILPITEREARVSGALRASRDAQGRPLALADALIAATAILHAASLVTRNVKDFEGLGVRLINPFT